MVRQVVGEMIQRGRGGGGEGFSLLSPSLSSSFIRNQTARVPIRAAYSGARGYHTYLYYDCSKID